MVDLFTPDWVATWHSYTPGGRLGAWAKVCDCGAWTISGFPNADYPSLTAPRFDPFVLTKELRVAANVLGRMVAGISKMGLAIGAPKFGHFGVFYLAEHKCRFPPLSNILIPTSDMGCNHYSSKVCSCEPPF